MGEVKRKFQAVITVYIYYFPITLIQCFYCQSSLCNARFISVYFLSSFQILGTINNTGESASGKYITFLYNKCITE